HDAADRLVIDWHGGLRRNDRLLGARLSRERDRKDGNCQSRYRAGWPDGAHFRPLRLKYFGREPMGSLRSTHPTTLSAPVGWVERCETHQRSVIITVAFGS